MMKKEKFNFTDEELKALLFGVISDKKYWVSKIERELPDSLEGTIITLKPFNNEKDKVVEVQFLYDKLEVSGLSESKERALYVAYFEEVFKKVSKLKESFEESKKEIVAFKKELNEKISNLFVDLLYKEGGFDSLAIIKNTLDKYRKSINLPFVKMGNHASIITFVDNSYNKPDREIKPGEVYQVNLDPVAGDEFGGIRPCIVVGFSADKKLYHVVPLSTGSHLGVSIGKIQEKDNFAVVSRWKVVAPERIYDKKGELDQATYEMVIKEFMENNYIFSNIVSQEKKTEDEILHNPEEEILEKEPIPLRQEVPNYETVNSLTLDMIKSNPVKLSEEQVMEIVEDWAKPSPLTRKKYMRKGKKLDYDFESTSKGTVVYLNKNYSNPQSGYYETKLEFKEHEAWVTAGTMEAKKEMGLTLAYQKKRLEVDPHYYISIFRYFVMKTNMSFVYSKQEDEDQLLSDKADQLKTNVEKLGISYSGNYQDLVAFGTQAIKIDQIHFGNGSANEDEDEDEME